MFSVIPHSHHQKELSRFEGVLLGLFLHFRMQGAGESHPRAHSHLGVPGMWHSCRWSVKHSTSCLLSCGLCRETRVWHTFHFTETCHMLQNRAVPSHFQLVNTGRLAASPEICLSTWPWLSLRGKYSWSSTCRAGSFFSGIFWTRFCLCVAEQSFYTQFMNLHWLSSIILWTCTKLETFL